MQMNSELAVEIHFLLSTIFAGIIGTGGMTLFMHSITQTGIANADMVRAIGSIFTRSLDSALLVGTLLHFTAGVIFAMIYTILFGFFGAQGTLPHVGIGILIGFMHGFVLSFFLVISVAEHHPLKEFREAGFSVAVAHLIGHIIYGALVGLVIGLSGSSRL